MSARPLAFVLVGLLLVPASRAAVVTFGEGDFAPGGPGCPSGGSGHTLAGYELVK